MREVKDTFPSDEIRRNFSSGNFCKANYLYPIGKNDISFLAVELL